MSSLLFVGRSSSEDGRKKNGKRKETTGRCALRGSISICTKTAQQTWNAPVSRNSRGRQDSGSLQLRSGVSGLEKGLFGILAYWHIGKHIGLSAAGSRGVGRSPWPVAVDYLT